jgi:hypothetical protein
MLNNVFIKKQSVVKKLWLPAKQSFLFFAALLALRFLRFALEIFDFKSEAKSKRSLASKRSLFAFFFAA